MSIIGGAASGRLRMARSDDQEQLLALWDLLFDPAGSPSAAPWCNHARQWLADHIDDVATARIPVVDIGGVVVASAVGTIESGVPNPHSPTGRAVRLANVITLPAHRRRGHATALVRDVIAWATAAGADRIDLSATPEGLRVYERLGFTQTSALRMKLVVTGTAGARPTPVDEGSACPPSRT